MDHSVLHKNTDGPQHEGDKQMHVDVVAGAVETSANKSKTFYTRKVLRIVTQSDAGLHFLCDYLGSVL